MSARTLFIIGLRSSSAAAPMMTTIAQLTVSVDVLPQADVFDVQSAQLIPNIEEVFNRPGDPVRSPYQDDVELVAAGIGNHLV